MALLGLSELLPITLGMGSQVTMTVPIHLALALIYPPWVAILITGLGALDIREFKREISVERTLYNRFQIMLAVGAIAIFFAMYPGNDFHIVPLAIAAIIHLIVNLGLVAIGVSVDEGVPFLEVLRELPPTPISGFFVSYAAITALGAITAIAHSEVGDWAVAAILIPLLFARLSFLGAKAQEELTAKVQKQQQALLEATQQVFEEREAERQRLAEHIHDSSLQLLAAAAYGAENTVALMDADRMDEAKQTLVTARGAVDQAIQTLRASLVDLRKSSIEEGGLMETVRKYIDQVSTLWDVRIELKGELIDEPPVATSLAALQILQEALINAVKHSNSDWIFVFLTQRDSMVHVVVEDQGKGFDTSKDAALEHVGLRLMSERAERVGGHLAISSKPGSGTRMEAILPGGVSA
jgi:signal transduction histidine kinase